MASSFSACKIAFMLRDSSSCCFKLSTSFSSFLTCADVSFTIGAIFSSLTGSTGAGGGGGGGGGFVIGSSIGRVL